MFSIFFTDSLCRVIVVTVSPDEHAVLSCVKGELFIKVVEVTGGFATSGYVVLPCAAPKLKNPIPVSSAVGALHSRHHVISWATEIEGLIIMPLQIVCPEATFELPEEYVQFAAGEFVLAIFFIVAMPAFN